METNNRYLRFIRRLLLPVALMILALSLPAQAAKLKIKKFSDGSRPFITLGQSITLTGEATGGTGKLYYRFRYKVDGGKTKTISKYSRKVKSVTFKPEESGTYQFQLTVKDKAGKTVSKTLKLIVKPMLSRAEKQARQTIIDTAASYIGVKELTPAHQAILDIYNGYKKNITRDYTSSRHYTMSSYDAWCDCFTSAVFIKAKMAKISGVECSCGYHVAILNRLDSFVEDDAYVPTPGDIIFYDWNDSGRGDCTGWPDHVGIVSGITKKGKISVIEGNYHDSVSVRTIKIDERYIRGYGVPKYAAE